MYLKRIELEGFKSFADRTVIPVERGLTGIVGPNGCGKSNIVDALLWVMGERSAKALRADAMDDVIFSGTEGRPAGNYAMVEVVLGDPDGEVVEPGGEVGVARRLFRSGEAEYLLNGRRVRRKDVRDVLMDTGLGVRGYMVLAQGKIDAVLAANPDERRSVFEEAAGISRYKARKHEAKLKLKRVDQDLVRVEDVLEEVSRAVRSLKLQAGKARRFLEMRDRYRELRVRFAFADSADFSQEERSLLSSQKELESQLSGLREARDVAEARLGELEREEEALRSRHDGLRSDAAEVKERAAGLEERVGGLEARASEGEGRIERDRKRLSLLDQQLQLGDGVESEEDAEERTLRASLAEAEQFAAAADARFGAARDVRAEARERMESLRRGVLDALSDRTQSHNLVAAAAKRRSEAEGALAAAQRRRDEIDTESTAAQSLCADLRKEQGTLAELAKQRVIAYDASVMTCEKLQGDHDGYAAVGHEARQRMAASRARLEALQVVDDEMPGAPEHVRAFVDAAGDTSTGWLLDGVQIAAPWDRMLESMLGRLQHGLWLRDSQQVDGLPKGSFDAFFTPARPEVPIAVKGAQPLRGLLEGDTARCDALCARLGAVYCVEDGAAARRFAEAHPGVLFVAADGEMHADGFARTGVLAEEAAGVLARRNRREQARLALALAETEAARAEAHEEETQAALRDARAARDLAEREAREASSSNEDLEARLAAADKRAASLASELEVLERTTAVTQAEASEASEKESSAAGDRDQAEARRQTQDEQLQTVQDESAGLEQDFDLTSAALQEARVQHAQHEQALGHWSSQQRKEREARNQRMAEKGALQSELSELVERCSGLRTDAESARAERSGLLERRGELDERVAEASVQMQRASAALHTERAAQSGDSGRVEDLLGKRQETALRVQRVQLQQEELVRGIIDEFGQALEDLARGIDIDVAQPMPADADVPALRDELTEMRKRIEAIGSVNLDAVQELEDRQQREEFMIRERDDLCQAKQNLEDTLVELDDKCRERFVATFDSVRGTFEQIFRRLFRGGRAEVKLEEGVDPLEAGIEITARPPGKELRSINLLSGGERTLTALALLLAVFRSRPSPFCLLDEVDAALDDSNVERFVDALQDFVGTTQFLVVTHNRITMARCERLFGVTMRKRGVSMVVSVELSQVQSADGDVRIGEAPDGTSAPRQLAAAPATRTPEPAPEPVAEAETEPVAEAEFEA